MKKFLLAGALLLTLNLTAQSVNNIAALTNEDVVQVKYDLNGIEGANYYVNLYYSTDGGMNYEGPLRHVSGDVASGIKAGTGKEIQWNIFKELNYQNEPIQFKVEAIPNGRKAKPATGSNGKLTITDSYYKNDRLIIEFEFLPLLDKETGGIRIYKAPFITTQSGEQYKPSDISFGAGATLSDNQTVQEMTVVNNIPIKGVIVFNTLKKQSVIPSLWMHFGRDYKYIEYVVNDIPVSQ